MFVKVMFIFGNFFYIKVFMLGVTMSLDILSSLTPQVTRIICQHMKKILKKRKKNTKIWGTKPNPICEQKRYIGRLNLFIKNSKNILYGSLLYQ